MSDSPSKENVKEIENPSEVTKTNHSICLTDVSQEPGNQLNSSNNVPEENTYDLDNTNASLEKLDVQSSLLLAKLCNENIIDLTRKLLWNSQMRKLKLQDSLLYIQKLMKDLIVGHKKSNIEILSSTNSENAEDIPDYTGVLLDEEVMLKPPTILRTASGEYLHMKPGAETKSSPLKVSTPKSKISKSNSPEILNTTDYEEMVPVICENEEACNNVMTQSGVIQTRIYKRAHNIFSTDMAQSTLSVSGEESNVSSSNDSSKSIEIISGSELSPRAVSVKIDLNLELEEPIDAKYQSQNLTVAQLCTEQEDINRQLHDVTCMIKGSPFPNPLHSAKSLLQLLQDSSVEKDVMIALCKWGLQYGYLSEHLVFFKNMLHQIASS